MNDNVKALDAISSDGHSQQEFMFRLNDTGGVDADDPAATSDRTGIVEEMGSDHNAKESPSKTYTSPGDTRASAEKNIGAPGVRVSCFKGLSPAGEAELLGRIVDWVRWLNLRYPYGLWLEPCWYRHGAVVEELSALRDAWLGTFKNLADDGCGPLLWHESFARVRERVNSYFNIHSSCSFKVHREDEPVRGIDEAEFGAFVVEMRRGNGDAACPPIHTGDTPSE